MRKTEMVMFESNEDYSAEAERELWEGYEEWLEEQADMYQYERGLWM